ncbi:MAG: GntR family transcriptional regulator [Chitinispirillaceae bacterium]
MNISIVDQSPVAVYEQIILQILTGLREKKLKPNTPLPTIRQLASDLDLTKATVAKAYQILERSRIIATGGRRGTFIHEHAVENADKFLRETVVNQTREFIELQLKYGIEANTLKTIFSTIIKEY